MQALRASLSPGSLFADRYIIIEEVGCGGMGCVFKARDRTLGTTVALKIILPEYSRDRRLVELFKKETLLGRSVSSEHVTRIHDLGEWRDLKYISMDFVEGEDLKDLVRSSGALTVPTAVKFARQVCGALAAAHKSGVIHCDLKPSNVIVDKSGNVKVMDFGIARRLEQDKTGTAKEVSGTPKYMSPEQARGEKLDLRTDIYNLGLILYEMVTGRAAFEAESPAGYAEKHCREKPVPPTRLNPSVPVRLEQVILKCLEKDRQKRYQTVEEVCRDLEAVAAPGTARPVTGIRSLSRRPVPLLIAGAVLIVAAAFVILTRRPPPPGPQRSLAVMSFENISGDPADDTWCRGLPNLITAALEQSSFLRLIQRETLAEVLGDEKDYTRKAYPQRVLDDIAARARVDYFLLGSLMKHRDVYRLDLRLIDSRKKAAVERTSFENLAEAELLGVCDRISLWARKSLGLTRAELEGNLQVKVGQFTTKSIPALIEFFKGRDFMDRGDLDSSNKAFRKAVEYDDEFALAYVSLSLNAVDEGNFDKAREYMKRAMALRSKLTVRDRLKLEADYCYLFEGKYAKAEAAYGKLLAIWPDDELTLSILGGLYRNSEAWEKAEACFRRLAPLKPASLEPVRSLVFIAEAQGRYDEALRLVVDNSRLYDAFKFNYKHHVDLARLYYYQGRLEEAVRELKLAADLDPGSQAINELLGGIHIAEGEYEAAEAAFLPMSARDAPVDRRVSGHKLLGGLYLMRGQVDKASDMIEKGLTLVTTSGKAYDEVPFRLLKARLMYLRGDYDASSRLAASAVQKAREVSWALSAPQAFCLMGRAELGRGDTTGAQKALSGLKELVRDAEFLKPPPDVAYLEAALAAAGGETATAAGRLAEAVSTLPHPHYMEDDRQSFFHAALGEVLLKTGDLEAARAEFEKAVSRPSCWLTSGEVWGGSLLRLAEIHEEKNEKGVAAGYLRRFVALMGEGQARGEDLARARRKLAALD
jgi:serine/threonine protein kinase/tetratricopeptide (TPR) repeat protein